MKHYSVINSYFRFKKLWRNRYITRYRVVKLRCLLENIIICVYKYVIFGFEISYKDACKKRAPLAIGLLLHHCNSLIWVVLAGFGKVLKNIPAEDRALIYVYLALINVYSAQH